MYEEVIDWISLSEVIGVIPAALLKIIFIWGVPLLIIFSLYLIYWLIKKLNYTKFDKRRIGSWKNI